MKFHTFIAVAMLAAPQVSAHDHLPAAPQYYLNTVIGMSLAEHYEWHCPSISVDIEAMSAAYDAVLEQLASEGIPTDAPHEHMLLPPIEETDAIIQNMLASHQSAANPEASFCAGARMEMDAKSIVGSFLVEVE